MRYMPEASAAVSVQGIVILPVNRCYSRKQYIPRSIIPEIYS